MRGLSTQLSHGFLGGAIYLTGWYYEGPALQAAQMGAISLLLMAGDTRIFIFPGYRIRSVDAMVTNFHLPESTLLMMVSAFAGKARVFDAYAHAIAARYRFFSYGDAMLLFAAHDGAPA